jgi:hypothetical protein
LSPDNGQSFENNSSVTLTCNEIADASQYEFEISYQSGGTWYDYFTYGTGTNAKTFWPSYDDTPYRWKVRAMNTGGWGSWSAWATFQTVTVERKADGAVCEEDSECESNWCGCNWGTEKVCQPSSDYPKNCKTDCFDLPLGRFEGETFVPGDGVDVLQNYRNRGSKQWFDRRYHSGVDLVYRDGANVNAPVFAAADGEVKCVAVSPEVDYPGAVVVVEHVLPDGTLRYTQYGHLNPATVSLNQDDVIWRGDQIGGILDQGGNSHVHFEYRDWLYDPVSGTCWGPGYAYKEKGAATPEDQGWRDPVDRIFGHRPKFPVTIYTESFAMNVRPRPSLRRKPFALIPANSTVTATDVVPDETGAEHWWYKVEVDGKEGYVAGFFWDGWGGYVYLGEPHQRCELEDGL